LKYLEIIKKIKSIRLDRGFSLSQLSQKSGLSKGYLSKIENQVKLPPVSTLQRIVSALDIELSALLVHGSPEKKDSKIVVVRKADRKKIGHEQQASGIVRCPLADKKFAPNIQPFIIELPVDHTSIYQFQGEEFHFILSGRVELTYGDKRFILDKGDFVYFDGDIPYTGRSLGEKAATIFMGQYRYKRDCGLTFGNLDVLSAKALKTNGE